MITSMSKIEIAGTKELLLELLETVRDLGTFQPQECGSEAPTVPRATLVPVSPEGRETEERLFLDNIRQQTGEILALMPAMETRESWLEPSAILDTVAVTISRHLDACRRLAADLERLRVEQEQLGRYAELFGAINRLVAGRDIRTRLELIGITLRESAFVERLRTLLTELVDGEFCLDTTVAADGTLIGLIAVTAARGNVVKRILADERLPEFTFPEYLNGLPMGERIAQLQEQMAANSGRMAEIRSARERFARQWLAFYRRVNQWLTERLSLFQVTDAVRQTDRCFVLRGWVAADHKRALTDRLQQRFGDLVTVEELAIREQDMEQVPVSLRNSAYFRPFELFTRLLPLPSYSSWDPTPFIGIFFPIFFGLMLGDAGYGLFLLIMALYLRWRHPKGALADAARILSVISGYSILFGILFAEFFGEEGGRFLQWTPLLPERSRAVMPMLVFSLALGISHLLLGLLLGMFSALKRREHGEVLSRGVSIALILCLAFLVVSQFMTLPWPMTGHLLTLIPLLLVLLILFGGLLAPLEMIRTLGNIVSYARIMAIGLSSALLASAANRLAGLTGDLVLGTLVALVLHAVAIALGLFAPAIHGLRLHFVEFFSKFVELGGKRFEPLHK